MKKQVSEGSLHNWFKGSKSKDGKGGWVNVVTGGTCASDKPGEGTPKCVSSSKRASMSKSERLSASRRKKKADPGQQSKSGAAKPTYVSTDKKKMKESYTRALTPLSEKAVKCWKGYEKKGTKKMFGKTVNNCVKKEEVDASVSENFYKKKYDVKKGGYVKTDKMDKSNKRSGDSKAQYREVHKDLAKEAYSTNPKQQAAIAISKKDRLEKMLVAKKKKQKMYEDVLNERQKDSDNQRLSQERGRSNYGKASVRNVRATGKGGNAADPAERLVAMDARHKDHKEKRGVKTKGMKEDIQQEGAYETVKQVLDKGTEFVEKNPVGRILSNIVKPVKGNKGKNTITGDEHKNQIKTQTNSYEPESETIEEGDKKGKGSGSKDACYHKVKSRYSVWPSAYASGALVKCRKVGAANWGNSSKKEGLSDWKGEFIWEDGDSAKKIDENILKRLRGKIDVDPYIDLNLKKPKPLPSGKQFYDPEDNFSGSKPSIPSKPDKPSLSKLDKPTLPTPDSKPDKPIPPISGGLDNMETIPGKPGRIRLKPGSPIGRMPILAQKPGSPIGRMPIRPNTSGFIGRRAIIRSHYDWREELNLESKDSAKKIEEASSPAWQRKEGKSESGGLNKKGVTSYRAANPGSKLKTAVTTKPSKLKRGSKSAKRRKSFCSRMKGMKKKLTSAKTARDPDSRINKALRKWNC